MSRGGSSGGSCSVFCIWHRDDPLETASPPAISSRSLFYFFFEGFLAPESVDWAVLYVCSVVGAE